MQSLQEHAAPIITGLLCVAITLLSIVWKSLNSKLDRHDLKIDDILEKHHQCQKDLVNRFVSKEDFNQQWAQFLHTRQADHAMINSRLHSLERQQENLVTKIDLFIDDSTRKMERLSSTFIQKEGEISKRIDNIADKINHGS